MTKLRTIDKEKPEQLSRPNLTVAVLAFNEERSFVSCMTEIIQELDKLPASSEILVVDDGSTDKTPLLADSLAKSSERVRVVHHHFNQGLGGAYRTAFIEARGELLTFFPADGQFPASIISQLHGLMEDQDLVLGYIPNRSGPFMAKALSWGERLLYTILFGGFPRFQGILMVRKHLIAEMDLVCTGRGWGVLMELILRIVRAKRRVMSVPTPFRPRQEGSSKVMSLKTILANLKDLIIIRISL